MSERNLITVALLAAEGTFSADQLRWMIFNAKTNGMEKCIRRIGRRVYIDKDEFYAWIDKSPSTEQQSAASTFRIEKASSQRTQEQLSSSAGLRFQAALGIAQGLASRRDSDDWTPKEIAHDAIAIADELLKQLRI